MYPTRFLVHRPQMSSLMNFLQGLENPAVDENPTNALGSFSLNVRENEERYTVEALMPGVKKEDLTLQVVDGSLVVRAERKEEKKEDAPAADGLIHQEFAFWQVMERSIRIPTDADIEKIEAEMKDGVLMITIAKTEKAKPKTIPVSVK